jgi:malonyl CoA-acyl carrier protein transacylase
MVFDTIERIEARLRDTTALKPGQREELLALLATLKAEVGDLSHTHAEQAHSIAAYTGVSAHEATRAQRNPSLLEHSLEGLRRSVDGFEKSHPQLVDIVNRIATTLSNLGI